MKETQRTQGTRETHPTVSVVIPTLDSAGTLDKCLASVRANNSKYKYEIIVVDAGSKDETVEIARRYADKVLDGVPCRINRNKGVENAKGDIICFTDSDCIVPENWIDGLVDGLLRLHDRDSSIVGVGGGNIAPPESSSPTELVISKAMRSPLISFRARNTATYKDEREVSHNPPINSACFRWVIDEIGGFREEPGYPEDLDLDAKIIGKGYKLYYLPDLLVYHKHKTDFKKFAQQMQDFGKKRLRVNRQHKNISRFYHYGPLFLCLMLYSPLFFIPLVMALINAFYTSLTERGFQLFIPVTRLTLSFYKNYGVGEMKAVRRTEK
jgi:glycosyltransferase involved in cell wall biosynthesis